MSRELLARALDALEPIAYEGTDAESHRVRELRAALREALAAPQPEPDRRIAEMEQLCAAIVAPPKEALDAFQKAFVAQLGKRKHYKKGWEDSAEIAGAKAFVATIAAPIIAGGFAAPPAAPAPAVPADQWKAAIDDELVCCHIGTVDSFPDAKAALKNLIDWHVSVALDPAVSSDAQALIERGKSESAAPAVREPLTEEQAKRLVGASDDYWATSKRVIMSIVRVTEEHYGIGGGGK